MDWTGFLFPRPDWPLTGARRYWIGAAAQFADGDLGDAPAILELLCEGILREIDVLDIEPSRLARYLQNLRYFVDSGRGEMLGG
ncbi:MAG: hypothetical protein ABSH22_03815 [Tepidisphaeraceae bacterium]